MRPHHSSFNPSFFRWGANLLHINIVQTHRSCKLQDKLIIHIPYSDASTFTNAKRKNRQIFSMFVHLNVRLSEMWLNLNTSKISICFFTNRTFQSNSCKLLNTRLLAIKVPTMMQKQENWMFWWQKSIFRPKKIFSTNSHFFSHIY